MGSQDDLSISPNIKNTQCILNNIKEVLKYTEKRLQTAKKNYSHDTNNKLLTETKCIFKYIKDNDLYDSKKEIINMDEYLIKTLQIKNDMQSDIQIEDNKYPEITYFNIQGYIVNALSN